MNTPTKTAEKIAAFLKDIREAKSTPQSHQCHNTFFSYAKKGELLPHIEGKTDPETGSIALENGFYQVMPVTQGNKEKPARWLGIGTEEGLTHQIQRLLENLPEHDQEKEWVKICAAKTLQKTKSPRGQTKENATGPEPNME
jgi:hypothetical protein